MTTPQFASGSTGSNPTTSRVTVLSDNEFDRFEALTRRLVRVPKDELDSKTAD